MSRWERWSNSSTDKKGFGSFLKENNPSAAMGPAERAKALGLQSNGKGGYIDPTTGQLAARTVNGELIFYDTNAPDGGAVSDGEGGQKLVQQQPSWADPLTGMLTTPPANPESPQEIAAIPDPTPATAPAGYNSFMQQKKTQAYQQNKEAPQPARMTPDEAEEQEAQAQQGDPAQQQAFAAEGKGITLRMFESGGADGAAKKMAAGVNSNLERIKSSEDKAAQKRLELRQKGPIGTLPGEMAAVVNPTTSLRQDQRYAAGRAMAGGGVQATSSSSSAPTQSGRPMMPPTKPPVASAPEPAKDGEGSKIDDLLKQIRSGEELTPEQQEEISTRRRAVRSGASSISGASNISGASKEDIAKVLKTFPEDSSDNVRRADRIWEQKHETELPGESATLQAIHSLMTNPDYQGVQEHLAIKPGSAAYKKLPKDVQDKIKQYHEEISDVLPSSHLNGSWQFASAKAAKLIREELAQAHPEGIPNFNLMKPYDVGGGANAMRLTNIPSESHDDTYSQLYETLSNYVGGEDQLRKVVKGAAGSSVRDNHDATDITLLQEGKGAEMIQEFQSKLDEMGFDASDGLTDEEIRTAVRALNDLKSKYDASGALRNISLKQILDNKPGSYEKKPSVDDMPEVSFDADNFMADFGFGGRKVQPEKGGRFVDTLDFNNQGINLPFNFGDRKMNLPLIPHPGSGDKKRGTPATMSHNPYGTLGSQKSEPTMSGKGGKMGALPSYTWFDETLDSYIPGGHEALGSGANFGATDSNGIRGLDENDRSRFMDMVQAAQNHQGDIRFNGIFSFMGEDLEPGDWFDKIKELDDYFESGRMDERDYDEDEEDEYTMGDKSRDFISKETRKKIREQYGSLPLSQIRQKIRRKMGGMQALRLFQMLESQEGGQKGEAFQRFIRDKIYVPGMKIDDMNSPGRIIA